MRHGSDLRADARSRRPPRRSSSGPRTTPTTRRSWPTPPTCRRSPRAVAAYVASPASGDWDVVDLRRLRCADPTGDALAAALGALEMANGWTLNVEREDVCPVVTLPEGVDIDGFLATLGKKERHEIRRKVRRAEARGRGPASSTPPTRSPTSRPSSTSTSTAGATTGCSRRPAAATRAACSSAGCSSCSGPTVRCALTFLSVGDRRIAAGIHFETADGPPLLQRRRRSRTRASCRPAS